MKSLNEVFETVVRKEAEATIRLYALNAIHRKMRELIAGKDRIMFFHITEVALERYNLIHKEMPELLDCAKIGIEEFEELIRSELKKAQEF